MKMIESAEKSLEAIRTAGISRPFVVGQLGQSLDGRIALPNGESKYINGPAALDHLHRLRAEMDAVVVGIGTVLTDDPQLTVRRVEGSNPARVIIDPNCKLKGAMRCLNDSAAPVFVIRRLGCEQPLPAGAAKLVLPDDGRGFTCRAIIDALNAAGLRRILIEGGANTLSRFIDEGQLDRLHLLVGPILLGAGKTGINLSPMSYLDHALRVSANLYRFEGGDILYDCDLRAS
jgi:riboflavin-specific deaminase-like protein